MWSFLFYFSFILKNNIHWFYVVEDIQFCSKDLHSPSVHHTFVEFGICWPLSVELISENVGNILPEALVAINSNEKKCIKIG
jgi:hypothetical protein